MEANDDDARCGESWPSSKLRMREPRPGLIGRGVLDLQNLCGVSRGGREPGHLTQTQDHWVHTPSGACSALALGVAMSVFPPGEVDEALSERVSSQRQVRLSRRRIAP